MLQIRFLGGLRVEVAGQALTDMIGIRSQSLLARLLLNQDVPLPRGELANALWPDSLPSQARTNLRRELHGLRRLHPIVSTAIQVGAQSLTWSMPQGAYFDVDELQKLLTKIAKSTSPEHRIEFAQALTAIDRGDLLPGVQDEWVVSRRRELQRSVCVGLMALAQDLRSLKNFTLATHLVERLIEHDELSEPGYQLLLQLNIDTGNRPGAQKIWQAYSEMLMRELSIEPDDEISRLYSQFVRKPVEQYNDTPPSTIALVGRTNAWQQINKALKTALSSAHMVVIEGEAGIGKTALAKECLRYAGKQGVTCLQARAYAAEGVLPYSPLKSWLSEEAMQAALSRLSPKQSRVIAPLLPENEQGQTPAQQSGSDVSGDARQRVFEVLVQAFMSLEQPLILLLDDLQWCDQDTLQWIRFLFRSAPTLPVLLVATARQEELTADHPSDNLIRALSGSGQLSQIPLGLLGREDTATLADQVTKQQRHGTLVPGALDADLIFRRSGGNPLFVSELVRVQLGRETAGEELPERIEGVIQQRMAKFSQSAVRIAELAAVVGRQFSGRLLEQASADSEDVVASCLDQLWQGQIINDAGHGQFVFAHDCLRESIYNKLSPAKRRQLHDRVARALLVIDGPATSGEIAVHYHQAGDPVKAADSFLLAAEHARQSLAFEECVRIAERGLAALDTISQPYDHLSHRLRLNICLGIALSANAGFSGEMGDVCSRIESLLLRAGDDVDRFDAVERLRLFYGNSNVPRALELSRQLVDIADRNDDLLQLISSRRSLGFSLFQLGQYRPCSDVLLEIRERISAVPRQDLIDQKWPVSHAQLALGILAYVLWIRGQQESSNEVYAELLALPIGNINPVRLAFVRHFQIENAKLRLDSEAVERHLHWMQMVNKTEKFGITMLLEANTSAWLLGQRGDDQLAISLQRKAIEIANANAIQMYQPQRWADLAQFQLSVGDLTGANESVATGFAVAQSSAQPFWNAELYRLQAQTKVLANCPVTDALSTYDQALDIAHTQEALILTLRIVLEKARLLLSVDQGIAAQALIDKTVAEYLGEHSAREWGELLAINTQAPFRV